MPKHFKIYFKSLLSNLLCGKEPYGASTIKSPESASNDKEELSSLDMPFDTNDDDDVGTYRRGEVLKVFTNIVCAFRHETTIV